MTYRRTPTRQRSGGSERKDIYKEVTDEVIRIMEEDGVVPWHQDWAGGGGLPLKVSDGKPYRGINPFMLNARALARGYESPWWAGYQTITHLGGSVAGQSRANGKGPTMVVYFEWILRDRTDEKTGKIVKKAIPFLKYSNVWNLDQVTWGDKGIPTKYLTVVKDPLPLSERIAAVDDLVDKYLANGGPALRRFGDRAYFEQKTDTITLPPFAQFETAQGEAITRLHEVIHSTGVAKRLDAPGFGPNEFGDFGSAPYSAEELRAELGASFAAARLGVDMHVTLPNSAAYLRGWLSRLRNDPKMLVQAGQRAAKAVDYVFGDPIPTHGDEGEE